MNGYVTVLGMKQHLYIKLPFFFIKCTRVFSVLSSVDPNSTYNVGYNMQ